MSNYFKPNKKPCLIVFYRSMTPEEGTGYCIRTAGSMAWKAIWETFWAGAHVVGVGYLLARRMLLILLNNFFYVDITPRYCWNPRLVGRLSPFKPTPKCHFPVQDTRFHPCQWKDKKERLSSLHISTSTLLYHSLSWYEVETGWLIQWVQEE